MSKQDNVNVDLMQQLLEENPEYVDIQNVKLGDTILVEVTQDLGWFYYTDSLKYLGGMIAKSGKHGVKDLNIWDKLEATLVSYFETKSGINDTVLLSVLPGRIIKKKEEFKENMVSGKIVSVKIIDANDWGFLTKMYSEDKDHAGESFTVFVPTSQLLPHHFPRVNDKTKQASYLKQFVGEVIKVKLLKFLDDGSIAASEKLAVDLKSKYQELANKIDTDEKIKVKVTGIKDNVWVFVTTEDNLVYGLIHISQIFNPGKEPLETLFKKGNTLPVRVMRCDVEKQQIWFTLRKFVPKEEQVAQEGETKSEVSETESK